MNQMIYDGKILTKFNKYQPSIAFLHGIKNKNLFWKDLLSNKDWNSVFEYYSLLELNNIKKDNFENSYFYWP